MFEQFVELGFVEVDQVVFQLVNGVWVARLDVDFVEDDPLGGRWEPGRSLATSVRSVGGDANDHRLRLADVDNLPKIHKRIHPRLEDRRSIVEAGKVHHVLSLALPSTVNDPNANVKRDPICNFRISLFYIR